MTSPQVAVDLQLPDGCFGLFIGLFVLGLGAASLLHRRGRARALARLIRGAALVATAVLLALIGPAAARASRFPSAPETDALTTVLVIDAAGSPDGNSGLRAHLDGGGETKDRRYALGELALEQHCTRAGCTLRLDGPVLPRPAGAAGDPALAQALDEVIEVLRGPEEILYLRACADRSRARSVGNIDLERCQYRGAFHWQSGRWVKTDERPELGVLRRVRPAQLVIVSVVGLALVLLAWAARLRASRQDLALDVERWEACALLMACHAAASLAAIVLRG